MSDSLRPDIEAAKSNMATKLGAGRETKRLVEYLWEDEKVDLLASGTYGPGQGLLALTDRRLIFIKDGVMSKTTEDFPMDRISSVQWSSGVLFGKLMVFASGNKAEIKSVDKSDGKRIADTIRDRLSRRPQGTAAAPLENRQVMGDEDVYEQLSRLAELRDAGVISNSDFEAKKAELLGRI